MAGTSDERAGAASFRSGVIVPGPRAEPEAAAAVGTEIQPDAIGEPDFSPVSIESLRRVLDGLRQLS